MRRRFGRGRKRNDNENRAEPIDAAAALKQLESAGLGEELTAVELDGVAPSEVALGTGKDDLLVGYSPTDGGAALLGVVALARSRDGFSGRALAAAPFWTEAARRRLGLLRSSLPFTIRAVAAGPQPDDVIALVSEEVAAASTRAVVGALARPEDRRVFERGLASLEGLAAKHRGVVQPGRDRVDLLLLADRVASLTFVGGRVRLEVLSPERSTHDLDDGGLATAFDRLEGALRKRLNDRRVRDSEPSLRASLVPLLEAAGGLTAVRVWPAVDPAAPQVDIVGVEASGRWNVGVARDRFDLRALGVAIDSAFDVRLRVPFLADGVALSDTPPRLLLAAKEFEASALSLFEALNVPIEAFDVSSSRGGPGLSARQVSAPPARDTRQPGSHSTARDTRQAGSHSTARDTRQAGSHSPAREPAEPMARERAEPATRERDTGEAPRRRGRGKAAAAEDEKRTESGFEEVSLFDLDDGGSSGEGDGERRRRRRGGRRRGRRGGNAESESAEASASENSSGPSTPSDGEREDEGASERRPRGRGRRRGRGRSAGEKSDDAEPAAVAAASDDDTVDEDEMLAPLAADAPELDVTADLAYEDEENAEEADAEADKQRKQREIRRRARVAKAEPEPPKPPRRRAAFVAHADRVSVLTAVLLARDVRLVEGFWVYPQEDLMTFFRSIATDLKEATPIFLVGFTASPPARDTFQAASLYSGQLHWFDHHSWPPEDIVSLQQAIGEDSVHIDSGADSSLAAVIAERTRRSRFSDKLVELVTGRFTQHDYERWGRVWWHRAGEIAKKRGERRGDIDALLTGRPSDLAKEAARIEAPPPPPEVSYVSERDFRLVHFGGFVMVVLEVPESLDLHLAARIARERYEAQLSLACTEGSELLVLGGDDSRSKRGLDLGGMADHLASKHDWVTSMRDDDHVARVRVDDLQNVPGRLDEVISEIAMGRSIVEG